MHNVLRVQSMEVCETGGQRCAFCAEILASVVSLCPVRVLNPPRLFRSPAPWRPSYLGGWRGCARSEDARIRLSVCSLVSACNHNRGSTHTRLDVNFEDTDIFIHAPRSNRASRRCVSTQPAAARSHSPQKVETPLADSPPDGQGSTLP